MTRSEGTDPTDLGLAPIPDEPPPLPAVPTPRTVDPGPSGPPATAEQRSAFMDAIRKQHGWAQRSEAHRRALLRPCSHCHASPGEACSPPTGHHRPRGTFIHEKRLTQE